MKPDIITTLAQQRTDLEKRLAAEQEARAQYALDAAKGSKEAQRGLEQAETELKRLQVLLERNAAARRQAEAEQSAEGRTRSELAARAAAQRATEQAVDRVTLAREIDSAFAKLGALLKEWNATGRTIRAELRSVVEAAKLTERQREDMLEHIGPAAMGRAASSALIHALKENGVGSPDGVYNDELNSISRPGRAFTFVDAAEVAADEVASRLSTLASARE